MAIQLDKSINVSTVVSVVTLCAAMGGAWAAVQSQITEQKTKVDMIQVDRADKWHEVREDLHEMKDDIKEIRNGQNEILQRLPK